MRCHGNLLDSLHSGSQEKGSHIHWARNMGSPGRTEKGQKYFSVVCIQCDLSRTRTVAYGPWVVDKEAKSCH